MAVNVGYLAAMICTIIVMLVFDHGQPALLYLVPGVIIAVMGTSAAKGEFSKMWDFDEEVYITNENEDEDKKDESKKD